MGLFGGILSGLGGIVGNTIGAIGSAGAVKKASKAQIAAQQQAIAEQQREYDQARSDYMPYLSAGTGATEQIRRLLGLGDSNTGVSVNGNPALSAEQQQAGALVDLRDSPYYQQTYGAGEEAVLQNAAATGGVRGGNTQASLYKLGTDTFSQVLQSMLGNLGGLASGGLTAASGITGAGTNMANNNSNSQVAIGNAQAGGILGQQAIWNNLSQQIQKSLSSVVPGGGKF